MNVNLVSDESNGYQYTSYFGEDIVIEPGSKTYLNYATLFRTGENVLSEDGTMTLTATELLPRKVLDSGATVIDNVVSKDFVIPKGTYTGLELQAKITSLISDFTASTEGNQLRYYFSNPQEETVPEGQGKLAVSLCLDIDNWTESFEFALSATDKFNAQTFGGGADGYEKVADTLSTDTQTYDNYGTPDDDFWHYSYDSTKKPYEALVDYTFETSHTGSVLVGLYGNKYATLTDPAGATPPMTTGTITPVLYTVDQPVDEVDPALGFSNSVDKTEIGGSDIILNAPAGDFYEGYKVELSSTTSTAASYGYCNVTPTPGSEGVLDFGSITGVISGLPNNTRFDLVTTGGTGAGFVLSVESGGSGNIQDIRINATGKITSPGSGYIVGDVLTLTEPTTPGTGSVSITVTKICNQGTIISFRWTNGNSTYEVSPWDQQVAALSMGSGFVGGQQVTIAQDSNAGGVTDTMTITDYSTSANFMVPACFVAVEFRGGNSQPTSLSQVAEVYMAQDNAGNFIGYRGGGTDWASQDKAIKRMKKIAQFSYVAGGPRKHLGLRTYYSTAVDSDYQGDGKKLYFRVVDIMAGEDSEDYVLYDSINTGHYFPHSFFTGIVPTTEDEVEIQVPFRVFVSAQTEDEGFRDIRYSVYDRIKDGATDQYQASICEKATISFSSELKKILGLTSTIDLFPSSQPSDPLTFEIVDLALFWSNKSYYIVVQELPLTNYKNRRGITADGSGRVKKGMIKNILANVPLPFEAVSTSVKPAAAGIFTGGLYEPNKKIIVDLQNQRIVTNRLTVQIFRMEDDTLADEIKQSIINFTIIKE